MQVELLNEQGQAASNVDVPDTVFGRDYNESLIHQLVVAYQANARQGTRAQKDREMVKHSTKKPFRQKGTGNARAGMTSSPLWRGGGRTFPNSPDENFTQKLNKKMFRAGMASILSQLVREGRLAVVDSIKLDSPKTKPLAEKFKAMKVIDIAASKNCSFFTCKNERNGTYHFFSAGEGLRGQLGQNLIKHMSDVEEMPDISGLINAEIIV